MLTRAELLQRKRAGMAALRAQRRAARACIDCATALDARDVSRCVRCAFAADEAQAVYRVTEKGRATAAASKRRRYWRDPEPHREGARLRRKLQALREEGAP